MLDKNDGHDWNWNPLQTGSSDLRTQMPISQNASRVLQTTRPRARETVVTISGLERSKTILALGLVSHY